MIFILISSAAAAFFVPKIENVIFTVPIKTFPVAYNESNPEKFTIMFGVHPEFLKYEDITYSINYLTHLFKKVADFVFITPNDVSKLAHDFKIRSPFIFVYKNKRLITKYDFPGTQKIFLRILTAITTDDPKVIDNIDDLKAQLDEVPLTILAPKQWWQDAVNIQMESSIHMTDINVLCVTPNVLKDLGLNETMMAVFRLEDRGVKNFKNCTKSFYKASQPLYHMLQSSELTNPNNQIFALTSRDLYFEHKDFLYQLADKYPDFIIGYLDPYYYKFAMPAFGIDFKERLDMHFFNFERKFYIDSSDIFTDEFLNQTFDVQKWFDAASKFLDSVKKGERKKIFASEPVPEKQEGNIEILVGKTYEDFINDTKHDSIVLFYREDDKKSTDFLPVYENFSIECKKAGYDFLKFGRINVVNNAAPIDFPWMPNLPHIEIFPMKNKSAHDMLRGTLKRDNFIWFIQHTASKPIKLEFKLPTQDELKQEIMNVIMRTSRMKPEDNAKLLNWLKEISQEVGLNMADIPPLAHLFEEQYDEL